MSQHDILFKHQHGFRSKLSTETQLTEFIGNMKEGMKDRIQHNVVVMDFAKAFGKVSHYKLIFKLKKYGIDEITCGWAESFLHNRSQRVVVDGAQTDVGLVTLGLPQGSFIGPILFLIYMNDMPDYIKHSNIRLFAIDTIIYLTVTGQSDSHKLQEDLTSLEKWGVRLAD